jgi:hypothetical protein
MTVKWQDIGEDIGLKNSSLGISCGTSGKKTLQGMWQDACNGMPLLDQVMYFLVYS